MTLSRVNNNSLSTTEKSLEWRGLKIDFVLQHTYMYYNYKVRLSTLYGLVHIFIFFLPSWLLSQFDLCFVVIPSSGHPLPTPNLYSRSRESAPANQHFRREGTESILFGSDTLKKKRVKQLCQSKHKRSESSRLPAVGTMCCGNLDTRNA